MDRDERELFGSAIQALAAKGGTLDLDAIGWTDALEEDEEAAVSLLFEAQGRASATSKALTILVGSDVLPLGDRAVRFGAGDGLDPAFVEVDDRVDLTDEQLARGRRALAHELVGSARAMLQLARDHAVDRVQFGVPISSFQAVRHRLAESLVAVETAAAAAEGAWQDASPFGAAMAKALAGRHARVVAKHAQQVCAGIGFTTEHDLHLHIRRTYALDHLLGDTKTLTRDLGIQLLATRKAPPLLPL